MSEIQHMEGSAISTLNKNSVNLVLSKKANHYKRFRENPFYKNERENTTILIAGLTERHNYFIRASMEGLGYKVRNLPTPAIEAFHVGREYCNNGQCNPAYFTIGNLIIFLKDLEKQGLGKKEIIDKYVYLTAGACGPCRFGMYESEYRLALRNSGFDGFRILTFQQSDGLNQTKEDSGLEFNEEFFVGLIMALMFGDILNDLVFKIRPYEINKGETDKVFREITEGLFEIIKQKQSSLRKSKIISFFNNFHKGADSSLIGLIIDQIFNNEYKAYFIRIKEKLAAIRIDNIQLVPRVKITGEFWAQITEGDGNFRIFNYLEKEGAEVIIEPVINWLGYLLFETNQNSSVRFGITNRKNYRTYVQHFKIKLLVRLSEFLLKREFNKLRKDLDYIPQELSDQYKLATIGHDYYNSQARGGEGHLEVAKSIEYTTKRLSHLVISVKPFGCLPSTQSDGVHSVISSYYPELLFLPIETSGEGEINAYSRVQMALTEAKIRCLQEFETALQETGLSKDEIEKFIAENPEYASAMFVISKKDKIISRAARFVYHVAKVIKKKK